MLTGERPQSVFRPLDNQLASGWALQTTTSLIAAHEQPTILDQIQSVVRREAAAHVLSSQRGWSSPEHGQALVQQRSLAPLVIRDTSDSGAISRAERIAHDQPHVYVAHQFAEPAMRKAPESVRGNKTIAECNLVGTNCLR
jgi:hypothetical protein